MPPTFYPNVDTGSSVIPIIRTCCDLYTENHGTGLNSEICNQDDHRYLYTTEVTLFHNLNLYCKNQVVDSVYEQRHTSSHSHDNILRILVSICQSRCNWKRTSNNISTHRPWICATLVPWNATKLPNPRNPHPFLKNPVLRHSFFAQLGRASVPCSYHCPPNMAVLLGVQSITARIVYL